MADPVVVGPARESDWEPRSDGSAKGLGFLGLLQRPDGGVMSEYSVGLPIRGQEMDVPSLVPTLTEAEVKHVLSMGEGDRFPPSVLQKAAAHAEQRLRQGLPVFAQQGEQRYDVHPQLPRRALQRISGDVELPPMNRYGALAQGPQ